MQTPWFLPLGEMRVEGEEEEEEEVEEEVEAADEEEEPELEIFADDVKCAHGAAIGQMDEMARYYMASRGIAPDVAQRLLVRAFIADALAALEDEGEAERLLEAALNVLEARK